jgi:hypothetical protein
MISATVRLWRSMSRTLTLTGLVEQEIAVERLGARAERRLGLRQSIRYRPIIVCGS